MTNKPYTIDNCRYGSRLIPVLDEVEESYDNEDISEYLPVETFNFRDEDYEN